MSLIDLVFPKSCLGCGKSGSYICDVCMNGATLMRSDCPYCEKASIDGFTHAKCLKKYGLNGLTSVFRYQGVVKKAIQSLKYKYATEIVRELALPLSQQLKQLYVPENLTLVPIPIFWHRQNVRGFNQSEEVGRFLATKMGWNFNNQLLTRTKSTIPQAKLSVSERKTNLKATFGVADTVKGSGLPDILLFDDVFTTGSTLHEACKVLKKAGITKVWGLTIAR